MLSAWLSQLVSVLLISEAEINRVASVFQQYADKNKESISEMNRRGLSRATVEGVEARIKIELSSKRNRRLAVTGIGAATGLMALLSIRGWRVAVLATSLMYLGLWYGSGSTASVSLLKAFELKWMTAKTLGTTGSFIKIDVVLPLIYLFVVILISAQIGLSYKNVRQRNKNN